MPDPAFHELFPVGADAAILGGGLILRRHWRPHATEHAPRPTGFPRLWTE